MRRRLVDGDLRPLSSRSAHENSHAVHGRRFKIGVLRTTHVAVKRPASSYFHCRWENPRLFRRYYYLQSTIIRMRTRWGAILPKLPAAIIVGVMVVFGSAVTSDAQTVRLNELMPSNTAALADRDGDYSDWFELYNNSDVAADLTGYGLSDDPSDPLKWRLPTLSLRPHEYFIVFASGKDSANFGGTWSTVVDKGDVWRYRLGLSEPAGNWPATNYNDDSWLSGPSGFGYGDDDDATIVPSTLSLYARITFIVDDPSAVAAAVFHVDYDDGFVAYLNGAEIARANIGQEGVRPAFDQLADTFTEPRSVLGLPPVRYAVDLSRHPLVPGTNVLAVQVHNSSTTSSDLSIIPYLSLGYDVAPTSVRTPPPEIAESLARQFHTSFRLSAAGESLVLSAPSGAIVDSVRYGAIPTDVSLGRQPDGSGTWMYFNASTPGESNVTQGYERVLARPQISVAGGRQLAPIQVAITGEPDAAIHYTTDGTGPTLSSSRYSGPISIDRTLPLRARAFLSGAIPSQVSTATYIFNEDATLPIVTLTTDPRAFFDALTGIYVMGPNASNDFPHFGANFWEDWERQVHIELFEPDGTVGLGQDAGVKISGGWSRGYPQKSLALFARGRYGTAEFAYPLFSERPYDSYQAFLLRNSGNDWISTMLRDGYLQELMRNMDVDRMAYRPAILYINGTYWGIHNIREKINEHYAAALAGVSPEDIDLLVVEDDFPPGQFEIMQGDDEHYQTLLSILSTINMSGPESYAEVGRWMDLDNYIDYQLAQIFVGNTDWPGNNVKFWRPRTSDGRWRWIAFDLDFGFGIWNPNDYVHNTLAFAADPNGPTWPNPPSSTFLFRKLLENGQFRIDFVNRFADLLNVHFQEGRMLAVLDSVKSLIDGEMTSHFARWGGSYAAWSGEIEEMRYYARNRRRAIETHFRNFFGLGARVAVTVESAEGGYVRVNREAARQSPWTGYYFPNSPLPVTAVPHPGYRFVNWTGDIEGNERMLLISPQSALAVRANFEPSNESPPDVFINEIHYHAPPDMDSDDWVELASTEAGPVDISGWQLYDGNGNGYTIPSGTVLDAKGYVVLARDTARFFAVYGDVGTVRGGWTFGLSNGGEAVILRDPTGNRVDSLSYLDTAPWPVAADGGGSSLELLDPVSDRTLPSSWQASKTRGGTPGRPNSVTVDIEFSPDPIPDRPALGTLYPNPFQTEVVIPFQIDAVGHVRVEVFNVMGQRAAVVADGMLPAGYHSVGWNGSTLPSGVYVVRFSHDERLVAVRTIVRVR